MLRALRWQIGLLAAGSATHGVCGSDQCPPSSGDNNVEGIIGSHLWQLACTGASGGGMATMPIHLSLSCMVLCSDVCSTAGNGVCEDGGPDSAQNTCHYGTDCGDCGPRDTGVGTECVEPADEAGFTCNDYISAGYSCLQMVRPLPVLCRCQPTRIADSTVGDSGDVLREGLQLYLSGRRWIYRLVQWLRQRPRAGVMPLLS